MSTVSRAQLPTTLSSDVYATGAVVSEDARDESAFYRTVDAVSSLRVEVWIRRLAPPPASATGEGSGSGGGGGSGGGVKETQERRLPPREADGSFRVSEPAKEGENFAVAVFSWAEKAFSPRETLRFVRGSKQRRANRTVRLAQTHAEDKYISYFDSVLMRDRSGAPTDGADLFEAVSGLQLYTHVDEDGFAGRVGTPLVDPATLTEAQRREDAVSSRAGDPLQWRGRGRMRDGTTRDAGSGWASGSRRAASMWLMASVELDKEQFRAQGDPASLPVHEEPLALLRAYTHDNLLEVRPALSEREAPDALREALVDAARARVFGDQDDDRKAGEEEGREGREGKARRRRRGAGDEAAGDHSGGGAAGASQGSGGGARSATAWSMFRGRRTYVFRSRNGGIYEYFVTNAASASLERAQAIVGAAAATNASAGPDGSGGLGGVVVSSAEATRRLLALANVTASLGVEDGDPLGSAERDVASEVMNQARTAAIEGPAALSGAAARRTHEYWIGGEIVAAVDFGGGEGPDGVSWLWGGGDAGADDCDAVFVHYQIDLPPGFGWRGEPSGVGTTQCAHAQRRAWSWELWETGGGAAERNRSVASVSVFGAGGGALDSSGAALARAGMGVVGVGDDIPGVVGRDRGSAGGGDAEDESRSVSQDAADGALSHGEVVSTLGGAGHRWVAHVNAPLDLELLQREESEANGADLDHGGLRAAPKIVFSVLTRDSFGRCRVQGYGSAFVPLTPGLHHVRARTWRPAKTVRGAVSDFFLGGGGRVVPRTAAQAADPLAHLASLPLVADGGNKFGVRGEARGSLALRFEVAVRAAQPRREPLRPPEALARAAAAVRAIEKSGLHLPSSASASASMSFARLPPTVPPPVPAADGAVDVAAQLAMRASAIVMRASEIAASNPAAAEQTGVMDPQSIEQLIRTSQQLRATVRETVASVSSRAGEIQNSAFRWSRDRPPTTAASSSLPPLPEDAASPSVAASTPARTQHRRGDSASPRPHDSTP